jgi:predicted Rossmann fold nucleotide-binding protein DprA/Smf involved in DNA uptake
MDLETMNPQTTTPSEELRHLIFGFRVTQALHAAVELGIADLLGSEPRSADDLATACGAHAPSLYRVLRLLASEGVFAETPDGRFSLTPMAEASRHLTTCTGPTSSSISAAIPMSGRSLTSS